MSQLQACVPAAAGGEWAGVPASIADLERDVALKLSVEALTEKGRRQLGALSSGQRRVVHTATPFEQSMMNERSTHDNKSTK
jgi:hypothetical protein